MSIAVRGLAKSYGAVRALRGVDLSIAPGSVHALLGPNGAGKSTLIACLAGATKPDRGEIVIDETRRAGLRPAEAREAGISVIYQKFSLIDALSVEDNIFLGSELTTLGFRRRRTQRQRATAVLERLNRSIPTARRVGSLPIADRQLVEIAKALLHESKALIFDEPTASLSAREARALGELIHELKAQGLHILYVTHRLDEVFELADHVTVLRDGEVILTSPVAELTRERLVAEITGGSKPDRRARSAPQPGKPILTLDRMRAAGVGPVSLTLSESEVVGVFGMLGSGRTELLEAIYGLRPLEAGSIAINGADNKDLGPAQNVARGIALVPAERVRQSLFMSLPACDNVLLPSYRTLATPLLGIRRRGLEQRRFDETAAALSIRPARPRALASAFSGGNQQKIAIGRWLNDERGTRVLLLDEPTQGIDVGTRAELYRILVETARDRACAVLFTSSEPEEVVTLAQRALVLDRGRVAAHLSGPQLTEEALMDRANPEQRSTTEVVT